MLAAIFNARRRRATRVCLRRVYDVARASLYACLGVARVSFHARMRWTTRASSWTRAREGRRGHLLGARVLSCALAHGDVCLWSPLLCTLVQCRCGHSSPKDAGVWA